MMEVVFRVDASRQIGTGHVMRCLTLADYLVRRGADCHFIHRAHQGHMAEVILSCGHGLTLLPAASDNGEAGYAAWLGTSQAEDAAQTRHVLQGRLVNWLIVDHYGLDANWERELRPYTKKLAVLDDLANRCHEADLLIDHNYASDPEARYGDLLHPDGRRLCGPRYALLRPEYAQARSRLGSHQGRVSRVLVFYGGADASNETVRALRVLSRREFRHLHVDVVVGSQNPHHEEVQHLALERPRTVLHEPLEHLADLMADADLCLGAGGTTTWERCALGVPSLVTAIADNQRPSSSALAEKGAIDYVGTSSSITDEALAVRLGCLLRAPRVLRALARNAWRMTDGLGAMRVAEALLPSDSLALTLRSARPNDKALYFEWVNDATTRRYAHDSTPIRWENHDAWFDQCLQSASTWLWVAITPQELPVGQVRIDVGEHGAILDYSLDIAFRGRRWARQLLRLAVEEWRDIGLPLPLVGEVRSGNLPSVGAFRATGVFTETVNVGGWRFTYTPDVLPLPNSSKSSDAG